MPPWNYSERFNHNCSLRSFFLSFSLSLISMWTDWIKSDIYLSMIYFTVKADINALKVIQNIYNLDWIFVNCWDLTTFIRPGGDIGTTLQFDSQDKDCWEDEQGQLQTELSGGGEISAGVTVTASMTFPRCFCLLSASSRPRTRETVLSVLSCLPCPARPTLGLGISPWLQWRREAASTDIRQKRQNKLCCLHRSAQCPLPTWPPHLTPGTR